MAVTAIDTTNTSQANPVDEDVLGGWHEAYRLNLLGRAGSRTGNPDDDTLAWVKGQNELRSKVRTQADQQRRDAVKTVLERIEAERTGAIAAHAVYVSGMEKWEGRILEVDDDFVTVELVPLGGDEGEMVVADFQADLLSNENDVQPGDVVYVTVRTVAGTKGGPPSRTSAMRLRRLGKWTQSEISAHQERARERMAKMASRFV